jgi:hypothetical protein
MILPLSTQVTDVIGMRLIVQHYPLKYFTVSTNVTIAIHRDWGSGSGNRAPERNAATVRGDFNADFLGCVLSKMKLFILS